MPTINKGQKKKSEYKKNGDNVIAARIYNTPEWKALRKAKKMSNPICEICWKDGKVSPTEEIHHIKPILSGKDELQMMDIAYDYDNLISLCKECHHKIHNNKLNLNQYDETRNI